MKKIKITEKQAKLLETLNSKKVLKVTKEQYNRIIESELNRPPLTETPELHEEEINEDLFREFVNELYGLNEEGAECKYDKLNRVMEAAGLIEGGKLVKEKFGKDARNVKKVVGKGLMKYEECGSVYEAVQCMEESLSHDDIVNSSRKQTLQNDGPRIPGFEKGYGNPEILQGKIRDLAMGNNFKSTEVLNYLNSKDGKTNLRQLRDLDDLKELLNIVTNAKDPNQDSMELDEREHLGGKRAVGLDILNVAPFSELPETSADTTKDTLELKIPNLDGNGSVYVKNKDYFRPHVVKQIPPYTHRPDIKQSGYVAEFKRLFGAEPVFTNIGEPYSHEGDSTLGAKIDLNLAPKFRKRIQLYDKTIKSDRDYYRSKGKQPYLEEMDSISVGNMSYDTAFGSGKPAFESNVNSELTDKIYEALKKKVISEMDLATLGNYQYPTPGFEDVKMKGNHPKGKGKTFKKPAIKGGKFVKVNEKCKTFPYCNQGDMGALQLYEALKLERDEENNKLVVVSDLEGQAGKSDTFKNKTILKSYGFEWINGAWRIDYSKIENAKKALTVANKVEYLIDKLEDLEELVDDAVNTDKKGLLKAKLEQYISDLANATDERAVSAEIKRYLTFFAKFHQYSFSNRILVYIQRPDATKVASFTTWKSKNRKIKQGAKGILILRPLFDDKKVASLDLTDLEKLDNVDITNNTTPRTYKAEHVFDISDTEPMNEKGEIPAQPKWWGDNEPSETADDLFEAVKLVATKLGIKVTASDAKGGEKGYSAGGHINLTSDVEGAGRVSTMVHELAHELMHWKDKSKFYIGDEHKSNKALLELQAESVSYTVLAHYDIPTQHHATYLALWKANKETIERNLKIISEVSQFIVNEIDKVVDEQHIADDEGTKARVDEIINEMVNNLN